MVKRSRVFMLWCILLYLLILTGERVNSLARSLWDPNINIFGSLYSICVYSAVIISLGASLLILIIFNRPFLAALFTREEKVHKKASAIRFSLLAGVLLISGMVHTEYTMVIVQFVAYGFLIIALLVATASNRQKNRTDVYLWLSLLHLIAYSMAIPVVYETKLPNATVFLIVESAAMLILVGMFTFMMYKVFAGKTRNLFYVPTIHLLILLNAAVLWLRWKEEINYFVLVATVVAVVTWLVGNNIRIKK